MIRPTRSDRETGRTAIRCRRCRYLNLGIDIWCARCGSFLDWEGERVGRRRRRARRSWDLSGVAPLGRRLRSLWWVLLKRVRAVMPSDPTALRGAVRPLRLRTQRLRSGSSDAARRLRDTVARLSRSVAILGSRRVCPGCGFQNEPRSGFCARCGSTLAPARRPPDWWTALPPIHVSRTALAIIATGLLLVLAPVAFVFATSGRGAAPAARPLPTPSTARPSPIPAPVRAAIPGVESKSGLKYAADACPAAQPCLIPVGETHGTDAAAVQFSAGEGRACLGYVFQDGAGWHYLDGVCGPAAELTPNAGHEAVVRTASGGCVNLRGVAGLSGRVVTCLASGTRVSIDGGPDYVDGKLWWHLPRGGWMAHEFLAAS